MRRSVAKCVNMCGDVARMSVETYIYSSVGDWDVGAGGKLCGNMIYQRGA